MEQRTVTHSTFVIERSYPAAPERIFAAFADPGQKKSWFAGDRGMPVESYEMDFRIGGIERARYRLGDKSPFPGAILGNDTVYQDIVPGQRIVFAYTMSLGGRRFSVSLATIELVAADGGTNLIFTDQGAYLEGADGPQIREQGWQNLLGQLQEHLASDVRAEARR